MKTLAVLLILVATFAVIICAEETGNDATTNHQDLFVLGCLLAGAEPHCAFRGVLPARVADIYHGLNTQTQVAVLTGDFASLPPEDISQLPPTLVYLLPLAVMKTMSGPGLGMLLQKHNNSVALAVKIVQAIDGSEKPLQFLDVLIGTKLPIQTQRLLGDALLVWWPNMTVLTGGEKQTQYILLALRTGSPLLAYLPASVVREFRGKTAEKFLYHLRSRNLSSLRTWFGNSKLVRRVWAELVFREIYPRWGSKEVKGYEFLISGATPSEILNLTKEQLDANDSIFNKTVYEKLQAQALFSMMCGNAVLTRANLSELLPIVMQLSPHDLQHFAVNATDFRNKVISPDSKLSSFATDKQIGEILIAQAILEKRLPSADDDSPQEKIKELGQFAYTLPSAVFQLHKNASARQWSDFLASIDSKKLSRKQAWLVTIQGTFLNPTIPTSLLGLHGLLKAIQTRQFVQYETGKIPHNVLSYLASSLPNFEPVMSADLLHKLRYQLDEDTTLEDLLLNEDPNQFFSLFSSREIQMRANEMFTSFKSLWKSLQTKIENLPQPLLSVLLQSTRIRTSGLWKTDELTQHIAFMGLSCNVVDKMESIDTMDILSHYNGKLSILQKSFPKDLQYCCQQAVYRYLKEKAYLRQKNLLQNVVDLLEPAEVQAVGGYILASIPPPHLEQVMHRGEILYTIGQQPLAQLWEASGQKSYLDSYAQLALENLVDIHSNFELETSELLSLGSLVHFLTKDTIEHIQPSDFRFYLEALEDSRSKTLCSSLEERKAWYELIKLAFGPPTTWTETTLSTLGDWLVAVPFQALDKVPSKYWTTAIDDLVEKTSYHLELTWPGMVQPLMFVQACSEVLKEEERSSYHSAVSNLLNRYLIASQSQLDTIVNARQLVASSREFNKVVTVAGVKVPKMAMEIEVIQPQVVAAKPSKENSAENVTNSPETTTNTASTTSSEEVIEQVAEDYNYIETDDETNDADMTKGVTSTTPGMQTPANSNISAETLAKQTTLEMLDEEEPGTMQSTVTASPLISQDGNERLKRSASEVERPKVKPVTRSSTSLQRKRKTNAVEKNKVSRTGTQKIENDNRTRRKITCDAIRALGPSASLALQTFDIDQMAIDELINCLEVLGGLKLPHSMCMQIWRRVKSENKTVLISDLAYLGHLVQAIEKEDVDQLDLNLGQSNTLDVLAVLGRELRHARLLEALGERFVLNNTGVSNIGPAPLIALGRIICELPFNTVRKLINLSFLSVVTTLGQTLSVSDVVQCHGNCLDQMARLATEDSAFSSPSKWSAEDLSSLGAISAGLLAQNWQLVNASAMYGLTPSAVKCIVPHVLKELSVEQLLHLSPLAAAMVSTDQFSQLSDDQKSAVSRVRGLLPVASSLGPRQETGDGNGGDNGVSSGTAAVGMNTCVKDRQLFLKYLRNEMFVLVYMFIFSVMIINAY